MTMNDNMHFGFVKYYNAEKGFGFIKEDGKQYYFHVSGVIPETDGKNVKHGMMATFSLIKQRDGREKAVDVILTEGKRETD